MLELTLYIIILLLFITGAIYNFGIRIKCIYPTKLAKINLVTIITTPLIFIVLAYLGGNLWYHYILSLSGAIYLISSVLGQGIHDKGIYCLPLGRLSIFRLAKWEDIKGVSIDSSKNKIHSYTYKSKEILLSQHYKQEDFPKVKKMIEKKIT